MKALLTMFKGAIAVLLFFALWLGLRQINWIEVFDINETAQTAEEKIGDAIWKLQKGEVEEVLDSGVLAPIDSLLTRICKRNNILREDIKLHLVKKEDINAFALPDGHLVIFTGLVEYCETQEELAGVMGHELAHIELNHVMKKLIKEVGLAAVLSAASGDPGSAGVGEIFRIITSSAYDRSLESDADRQAVEYLENANLDAVQLGHFLYRLSEKESSIIQRLEWVSSHPLSMERAQAIANLCKNSNSKKLPVLTADIWETLQNDVHLIHVEEAN